jgi:hypothetical protein
MSAVDSATQEKRGAKIGLVLISIIYAIPVIGTLWCAIATFVYVAQILVKSADRLADFGVLLLGSLLHAALVLYFWYGLVQAYGSSVVAYIAVLICIFVVNFKMLKKLRVSDIS